GELHLFGRWFRRDDWCCPSFRELHEARYGRELFVFVRPPGWGNTCAPSFWLAFRSVRQQDLPQLPGRGFSTDVPLTISTYRRIIYCPGCGAELEWFYRDRYEKLLDPVIFQEFELPTSEQAST